MSMNLSPNAQQNIQFEGIVNQTSTQSTKEAYDAFKSGMDALKEAFNASGFETSGFDLSWSGNSNENSSSFDDSRNFHGFAYERNLSEYVEDSYGMELVRDTIAYGSSLVNMMA